MGPRWTRQSSTGSPDGQDGPPAGLVRLLGLSLALNNSTLTAAKARDLIEKSDGDLSKGLKMPTHSEGFETGRLFFHMDAVRAALRPETVRALVRVHVLQTDVAGDRGPD